MWKKIVIGLIGAIGLAFLAVSILNIMNAPREELVENGRPLMEPVQMIVSLDAIERGILLQHSVTPVAGTSVFSVLRSLLEALDIPMEYTESPLLGVYVSSIGGFDAGDYGPMSGWMVRVDDEFIGVSISEFILEGGEKVEILYTTDGGADLGVEWEE